MEGMWHVDLPVLSCIGLAADCLAEGEGSEAYDRQESL
jgi:hypothetical protein